MASTVPSTMHLLAKFGPLTPYVFIENEAISSWAVCKRSTNTELETDISRNVHFQLYHTYRHRTISRMEKRKTLLLSAKVR